MHFIAVTASTALQATIGILLMAAPLAAQSRIQFPSPNQTAPAMVPVNPNVGGGLGQGGFQPLPPSSFQPPGGFQASSPPPGAVLGGTLQPFDPYALPGNMGPGAVGAPGFPSPSLSTPPASVWPGQPPPSLSVGPIPDLPPDGAVRPPGWPSAGSPYGDPIAPLNRDPNFNGSPYATNPVQPPQNPFGANPFSSGTNSGNSSPPYQRLFQDTGLRGTYLYGTEKDDLSITEAEASTTAYFPRILGIPIQDGLRVTPGFAFHWTDGPHAPERADVPARLYSAYLDVGLDPQFNEYWGAELTARVGIYSDFQKFDSSSIRLLGTAVGVYQMSPQWGLKLGVAYIDRVKYKLLPAAGFLWTPNPQTRWDIFFPAPKLSNYWTTVGNQQVWWYLGGEYGGGSWTIEREDDPLKGKGDRLDINDIRIYLGIESWTINRYYCFAEIGYVFDRELVYYRVPGDSGHVDETFMVRAGVSW